MDRYEYYNTDDDGGSSTYGIIWNSQTFTPVITHAIGKVRLLLYRVGSPNTITVSIKGTTSDHPSGDDLCIGTTDGNTLPTGSPYEWREVVFNTTSILTAGTKYAIVIRALTGNASNYVMWRSDISSATYTGGCRERSGDSGGSWTSYTTTDFMFEEWGDLIIPNRAYTVEIRDSSGNLVNILENAHDISYTQEINAPYSLSFNVPSDDSKEANILLSNEYWLRDNNTGSIVKKFKLLRKVDTR